MAMKARMPMGIAIGDPQGVPLSLLATILMGNAPGGDKASPTAQEDPHERSNNTVDIES